MYTRFGIDTEADIPSWDKATPVVAFLLSVRGEGMLEGTPIFVEFFTCGCVLQ